MASFKDKTPVNFDKIYTPLEVIQKCNRFLVDILINEGAEIDQIIDPAAGPNIWLNDLLTYFDAPVKTYSLDIAPDNDQVKKFDWLKLKDKELKYSEHRLIVTNPPYGRSNNGTVSFINIGLKHAKWVAMLVPTGTWTSIRIKNFNKRWKLDIGPINQIFKGCGIFNEKTNSCNISLIVYESANDPKKKLELPYGNILDDEEDDVGILLYYNKKDSHGPYIDKISNLNENDIHTCAQGSLLFQPCNPAQYDKNLCIRFKTEELRQQYLNLDFKKLTCLFKENYETTAECSPWRWYEIVSRFMDLKKKRYKVSLKSLGNGNTHPPLVKEYKHLFQPNDIFCCALGLGCLFKPCDPFKYQHVLWIRFYDQRLRQQYLSLDFKALNKVWISIHGTTSQATPWRWFEFISTYINLNPEE